MTLIAIDMDGTLLTKDGSISNESIQAIYDVQGRGHRVAICSGRSHPDIKRILQNYNLKASIISGNGAMVYHDDFLVQMFIPLQTVKEMIEIIKENEMFIEIYTDQGILMEDNGKALLYDEIEQLAKMNSFINKEVYRLRVDTILKQNSITFMKDIDQQDFTKWNIYKINAVSFDTQKQSLIKKQIEKRKDISITSGGLATLEFGHHQTNKGFGLTYLANHLAIPMEETLAIGDHLNDVPMFKVAGTSVAMGNAEDFIKNLATYITTDNNHDGVAHALRKYVMKEQYTF